MYTQPDSKQHGVTRSRVDSFTFYTLLCFALAGLITILGSFIFLQRQTGSLSRIPLPTTGWLKDGTSSSSPTKEPAKSSPGKSATDPNRIDRPPTEKVLEEDNHPITKLIEDAHFQFVQLMTNED